jgi:hypothetical protein
MTDVTPEPSVDLDKLAGGDPPVVTAGLDAVDEQLIAQLAGRARAGGLALTGEGGLLAQLTKRLVESALEGEITDHLGYERHDVVGRDGGNSRNGHRAKTVLTEVGPVEIEVPRDRDGSFEPRIVAKRQRRLAGVDELVISLSAKGLTTGEVQAHLAEVYGAQVFPRRLAHYPHAWFSILSASDGRQQPLFQPGREIASIEPLVLGGGRLRGGREHASARSSSWQDLRHVFGPHWTPGPCSHNRA